MDRGPKFHRKTITFLGEFLYNFWGINRFLQENTESTIHKVLKLLDEYLSNIYHYFFFKHILDYTLLLEMA